LCLLQNLKNRREPRAPRPARRCDFDNAFCFFAAPAAGIYLSVPLISSSVNLPSSSNPGDLQPKSGTTRIFGGDRTMETTSAKKKIAAMTAAMRTSPGKVRLIKANAVNKPAAAG
jgi:hypothetical protein